MNTMIAQSEIAQPLKWHGGKTYLADRIIDLMPAHLHYVEPYFGGGAVLFAKNPEGVSEVVNDLNGQLTNFWRVLQNPELFDDLQRRLQCTPFSQVEWVDSADTSNCSPAARAAAFFIRCRQSMSGRMKSFTPLSRTRTRRNMNEQASAWMNAIDGLHEAHARLRRVVVLNEKAPKVILAQDGEATLFYCDPPYVPESRTAKKVYEEEMTIEQHVEMLDTLAQVKGCFLLSGYDNPLYREYERRHGWKRHEFDLPNNSASGETKRRMIEVVWMNR